MIASQQPESGQKQGSTPPAVLEVLAHTEDTTIIVTRMADGKLAVRSKSWDENKVILPDQVVEIRLTSSRIRIARKVKEPDAGDPGKTVDVTGYEGEITEFE